MLGGEIRSPAAPVEPFEVLLTQSLLDLFQLPARRRTAAAVFEQAKLRVADEVLGLVAEVRSVSYNLQSVEQVASMRRTIVESERASAELAIRQHTAGNITDLDLETVQGAYEQAKLDLARSENEALAERERLNVLMGVWGPETVWTIAQRLPDLPPEEARLEDVESVAISRRLDLAAARREMEAAARVLRTARAEAIGDITVGVHHERDAEGGETTGPSLDIPLPVFGRGGPAKSRAEARLAQSRERYAALAVEIRANVRAVRSRLVAARARVEYYRDVILPRRRRIVEQSQLEYNAMLRGIFQVLGAKQSEIEAQREYIEAQRDYWVSRADLEHGIGWALSTPISEQPSPSEVPVDQLAPRRVEIGNH